MSTVLTGARPVLRLTQSVQPIKLMLMKPDGPTPFKLLKNKKFYIILALGAGILLVALSSTSAIYNISRAKSAKNDGNGILVFGSDLDTQAQSATVTPGSASSPTPTSSPSAAPAPSPSPSAKSPSPSPSPSPTPTPPPPAPSPQTHTISYEPCYSPANKTIAKGDTINFVNNSNGNMWTASDPHPQHTDYPEFDAGQDYAPGSTYSFTFNKVGAWGYHNHRNSSCNGTITVQ